MPIGELSNGRVMIAEATIVGRYTGQTILNTLYYTNTLIDRSIFVQTAGAYLDGLANQVKNLWQTHVLPALPTGYVLDEIAVRTYGVFESDLAVWLPTQSYAITKEFTGLNGSVGNNNTNGPAPCIILRLQCSPVAKLTQPFAPKRGYLAIGPVDDTAIGSDGYLSSGSDWLMGDNYEAKFANVAAIGTQTMNLSALGGNAAFQDIWKPARVKKSRIEVLGVNVIGMNGWAEVISTNIRDRASFRRSRLPEN